MLQSFESPLEVFSLTLPDVCIDTVVRYTNQKYKQYCREHPRGCVACRFRGYRPAEEAAELLTADNDPDGNDLESSSEDDLLSIGEDQNQPILSNSDSDDTEACLTSSELDSEDDDELSNSIATDNYYKTRDDAVKRKRKIPSQRDRLSGINIVDANTRKCCKVSNHLLKCSI